MIKIPVSASREYNVIMGQGLLAEAGSYIKNALELAEIKNKKICIVTDTNVDPLYSKTVMTSLEAAGFTPYKFVFAGGEEHKTMTTITDILEYLASNKFTRSDLLLALGGGITGDITGFAAATYLRGIEFIQIPTTLLAIVDSSVGGKTGVNLGAGKNLAGAFWQPSLVLFDPQVLDTLTYDIKLDGIAEAIKAGYIADSKILELIETANDINDHDFLMELAAKAIYVKRTVVKEDERDHGSRQLLNFGHTIAHAIEKCSNYEISHGHAVAMGMNIVCKACDSLGWSEENTSSQMTAMLNKFEFPLAHPYSPAELTAAALQDKKIRGREITLVIPHKLGKCVLKTVAVYELENFISKGF